MRKGRGSSGEGPCFPPDLIRPRPMRLPMTRVGSEFLQQTYADANLFQRAALAWRDLPVPVIAASHGSVFGGGLQIELGADPRYYAPDAQISVMEMRWSLVPDMAASLLLRGLVRDDIARELICIARKISAEEALLMMGL